MRFVMTILALLFTFLTVNAMAVDCKIVLSQMSSLATLPPSLQQLIHKDRDTLTDRQKAIVAKATDYLRGHSPSAAEQLMALGVSSAQTAELMKPVVDHDLQILESKDMRKNISFMRARLAAPSATSTTAMPRTLGEFSDKYDLDHEKAIVSNVEGYQRVRGPDASDLLKSAILTGDRDLMSRAFNQALRFGYFEELMFVAAGSQNNWALEMVGRVCITRYLFFDRNQNLLRQGLRAFSEVKGEIDRRNIESMLYDLYDLMNSPAIRANENQIRTYGSDDYDSEAMSVLTAALPVKFRMPGDSARFEYLHERTDDPRFVARIQDYLRNTIRAHKNIGAAEMMIAQIRDPRLLSQIAHEAEQYSHQAPEGLDEDQNTRFAEGAMAVARNAYVMAGDVDAYTAYARRVIADSRFERRAKLIDFTSSTAELHAPAHIVDTMRAFVADPTRLNATQANVAPIKSWLESYDYAKKQFNKGENAVTSKFFYTNMLRHEVDTTRHFLKDGENANLEKIHEFQATADQKLRAGDYWQAYRNFTAARDLPGLEKLYDYIMLNGRPMDAVYVALAMEWIRSGHSPFEQGAISARTQGVIGHD